MNRLLLIILIIFSSINYVIANNYLIERCADNIFEPWRIMERNRWYKEMVYSKRCSGWFFKPADCIRTPMDKDNTKEKYEYWNTIHTMPLAKKMKNVEYPNYFDICKFDYENNPRIFEQHLREKKSKFY